MINDRKVNHQGLVAPELAVVMAYCKILLYMRLLDSDLPEDEYLAHDLERYFPPPLPERYAERMRSHRLRREIIATVVANQLVDRAGTTFAFRLSEETGRIRPLLARGYAVAREVFDMRSFWAAVEVLDNQRRGEHTADDADRGAASWSSGRPAGWSGGRATAIDIEDTLRQFESGRGDARRGDPRRARRSGSRAVRRAVAELIEAGVPTELAHSVAAMPALLSVFDIVEVAEATGRELKAVMVIYFRLGERLHLNWLRDRIFELPRANRWQALARAALRDDLYSLHRALTQEMLETADQAESESAIEQWERRNKAGLERSLSILSDIKASRNYDTTTLPVALREVRNLIRGGSASSDEPLAAVTSNEF